MSASGKDEDRSMPVGGNVEGSNLTSGDKNVPIQAQSIRDVNVTYQAERPPPKTPHGKVIHLPYSSIGGLLKGRETFLEALHARLEHSQDAATAITAARAIHGLGGVGKTRLAVEYAWRHAGDYTAVLCITADSPAALTRNLAALCEAAV